MKTLLIDNYDSFVYNLKQYLDELGCDVTVLRNDDNQLNSVDEFDLIVISPGPGIPSEAGRLLPFIKSNAGKKPILGVCLGMQAIGEVFGGKLILMKQPMHGYSSSVNHDGDKIFDKIKSPFTVGRYHSWILEADSLKTHFNIISTDNNGQVMGIKLKGYQVYGVQFHPESVLTEHGRVLIKNFIQIIKK